MPEEEIVEVEGKITAVLPSTMFRAELSNGHKVLAHISGKLRKHFIKITVGDIVKMEMSPRDLEKARIVYRLKTLRLIVMLRSGALAQKVKVNNYCLIMNIIESIGKTPLVELTRVTEGCGARLF